MTSTQKRTLNKRVKNPVEQKIKPQATCFTKATTKMSLTLFASLVLINQLLLIEPSKSQLECTIDKNELNNIIADIRSKGYTVTKQTPGFISAAGNNTELAPNTGGAYASVSRHINKSYHIEPNFLGINFTYKIGANTALLFHGCTPPLSQYFGYKTYLWMNENDIWIWGAMGNPINNLDINTYNRFQSNVNPPFDDLTTIISTADQETYSDIIDSYNKYDITNNMINLDHIPSDKLELGTNELTKLHTLLRVNLPTNYDEFYEYFANLKTDNYAQIFFITNGDESVQTSSSLQSPISTPAMKDRICDDDSFVNKGNESYLIPKYDELRDKLINAMENQFGYKTEKIRKIAGSEYNGFDCLEDLTLCGGNTPDALYYEDYNNQSFMIQVTLPDGTKQNILNRNIDGYKLRDDDIYFIIGVNHYNLGLAVFNQETIYNEQFVVIDGANINNFEYNNSAKYFNDDDNNYSEFYMIQYSRTGNCIQELVNNGVPCIEIDYDKLDNSTGFIVFSRAYLNPCTLTGPSKQQFLHETLLQMVVDDSPDGKKLDGSSFMVIIAMQILTFFVIID